MTKITYLIGAGASALSLPTVAQFPEAIEKVKELALSQTELSGKIKDDFVDRLIWLHHESKNHASVDTFARKLYLTKQIDKFNELKALLDCFFIIYQLVNKLDPRYDAFLAAILSGGGDRDIMLPDNLSILSWNYDFQIELAASSFFKESNVNQLEKTLNIYPNSNNNFSINPNAFNIIKLNGTSGGLINSREFVRKHFLHILNRSDKEKVFEAINNFYSTLNDSSYNSSILFAWEKNNITNNTRELAQKVLKETEILVVIGYSFPTFNREIDKALLNSMENVSKIVIQSPEDTINSVELRIKELIRIPLDIYFERNTDKHEFFIPFEF